MSRKTLLLVALGGLKLLTLCIGLWWGARTPPAESSAAVVVQPQVAAHLVIDP